MREQQQQQQQQQQEQQENNDRKGRSFWFFLSKSIPNQFGLIFDDIISKYFLTIRSITCIF